MSMCEFMTKGVTFEAMSEPEPYIPPSRVKRQYDICCLKKELSMMVHGSSFFRNKTFLFVKIES